MDAIHEILDGDGDLSSPHRTAAGKTEAAFLPILSRIVDDQQGSVRAVYAGPLKALINDQFLRLERLCEEAEIPVHKWHGDVGRAAKKRLLETLRCPSHHAGVDRVALRQPSPHSSPRCFARLGFFVIDEMHSFLGNERGAHLRSLMTRLAAKSREPVRRIGLSATLGDPAAAMQALARGQPSRSECGCSKTRRAKGYA